MNDCGDSKMIFALYKMNKKYLQIKIKKLSKIMKTDRDGIQLI